MRIPRLFSTLISTAAFGTLLLGSAATQAAVHWSSDFSSPPYVLNETTIGKGGWQAGAIDSGNMTDASVVTAPDGSGRHVMRVTSTSTDTNLTRRRTSLLNTFEKVQGEKVRVQASLAYNWPLPPITPTSRTIGFSLHADESRTPVYIVYSMESGLYLNGTYGDLTENELQILPANRIKPDSFYSFDIVLDFTQKKFDLTVTGIDVDDLSFTWTLENITFRTNHQNSLNGVDTIRLINFQGDRLTLYATDLSVTAIPEQSTVAFLIGGAGALALARSARARARH